MKNIKIKFILLDSSVASTKFLVEYTITLYFQNVSESLKRMRSFSIILVFVCGLTIENAWTEYLLVDLKGEQGKYKSSYF